MELESFGFQIRPKISFFQEGLIIMNDYILKIMKQKESLWIIFSHLFWVFFFNHINLFSQGLAGLKCWKPSVYGKPFFMLI